VLPGIGLFSVPQLKILNIRNEEVKERKERGKPRKNVMLWHRKNGWYEYVYLYIGGWR
jgi:hypothetical protein